MGGGPFKWIGKQQEETERQMYRKSRYTTEVEGGGGRRDHVKGDIHRHRLCYSYLTQ